MKKILLFSIALLGSMVLSQAQNIVTHDLFEEDQPEVTYRKEIHPGMRYREYKRLYHPHYYVSRRSDPYNPFLCGVASLCVPGLGQCFSGEWGRGIGIFAVNSGLKLLFLSSAAQSSQSGREESASIMTLASGIGVVVHGIWNIVDAVHVAKIKNMYFQELVNRRASLDFRMDPFFTYAPTGAFTDYQPVTGVSFKVTF